MKDLWVVITTINEPTEAIYEYIKQSKISGFKVLIVGDTKTPDTYKKLECEFLSYEDQLLMEKKTGLSFPVRHYARKNFGYIYAINSGAEYIFDTDDDNIPYSDFMNYISRDFDIYEYPNNGFINVYKFFVDNDIWPRGYPLNKIRESYKLDKSLLKDFEVPGDKVIQFMADGEPDVDAIYRLVDNRKVFFPRDNNAYVVNKNQMCPFNSQATLYPKSAFILLYLPFTAPFRMTDIWRSFIFQIMRDDFNVDLVFAGSVVRQIRNEHDFLEDFSDEVLGYLNNEKVFSKSFLGLSSDIDRYEKVIEVYKAFVRNELIEPAEIYFYRK